MAEGSKITENFNFLALSGNDEVRPPTIQSCSSCKEEGRVVDATQYCIDCEEYQCGKCSKYHDRYNRGHDVLDESNRTRWGEQKKTKLPTEKCPKHIGEVLQIYCENHEELCCHVCVAMEHSACNGKQYIPEVAKNISDNKELQLLDNDIKNILSHINGVIEESQRNKFAISKSVDDFDKLVANTRSEINRIVDEVTNRARAEVVAESFRKSKEIDSTVGTGKVMVASLKELQLKIDPKTTTNKAQLFIFMKETKKNLDLISCQMDQISKPQPKSIDVCVNMQSFKSLKTQTTSLFRHNVIDWTPKRIQMQSQKRSKTTLKMSRGNRLQFVPDYDY